MVRPVPPAQVAGNPDMVGDHPSFVPLIKAMRLHNALGCGFVFLAGCAGQDFSYHPRDLGSALAVGLLCVASHLINDLVDLPADRTNRPERPLPGGRLSLSTVRISLFVTWVAGLALGLALTPSLWPWWIFWSIAGPGYSLWAKGRGWLAPVWTAAVITSCCIPGLSAHGLKAMDVAVLAFMFWYLVFREIVKMLADYRGDCLAGYHPFGGSTAGVYFKTFILGLPLALVGGWFMLSFPLQVERNLGLFFMGCLVGSLGLVWNRLKPKPHLAGSLLKLGAFSGLALMFIVSP